jgi:putative endonuclease
MKGFLGFVPYFYQTMSKHSEIGIKGEQIAADFLQKKGYKILHRNWRSGNKEIDIIAAQAETLVIVEIKTRTSVQLCYPEETVTLKKKKFLKFAAENFILENPNYINIRFDIISILSDGEYAREIVHFEEAFY